MAAIFKLSHKPKGPSRGLHVLLNENPRSVKMENLVNPRCMKQKYIFSQRVFQIWSNFVVSIIIQASYKDQLLKITVRITPALPKILGRTRRAFNWQKKLQQALFHYVWENVCMVQVWLWSQKFAFNSLSIFYFTGFFQVPAVHWWIWRQDPWLLTCWQGAAWLQDYLISLLSDSKKQYKSWEQGLY